MKLFDLNLTKTLTASFALLALAILLPELADAAGNFSSIDKKGKETTDFLTGTLAVIVITIALVVELIWATFFELNKKKAITIAVCAVCIAFVGEIVVWLLAK